MTTITHVTCSLQSLLGSWADEVAKQVPVIQRRRKFSPATLARTFILGFLAKPNASEDDLARTAARCGVSVTSKAIEDRYTDTMAQFLEALFRKAIGHRVQSDRRLAPLLERFPTVVLLDSTSIALPDELSDRFPGCGGSHGGGRAAIKLQVQLDLGSGALDAIAIEPGKDCDQRTSLQSAPLPAGSLRIADLGSFDTRVLENLQARGDFGISRLAFGTEIFTAEGEPIAQIADLFEGSKRVVDRQILVGKRAQLPCRIVIWRAPQEVADGRRRKLIATAREKGNRPPSRERLAWCDWSIFVTNVASDKLSVEEIGVLYRARWQIELMFKRWKSLGQIADATGATVAERLVRFWSRLLAVVVQHWILVGCAWGEIHCSLHKACVSISAFANDLVNALGDLERLIKEIERISEVVGKLGRRDKRKRPGTFELLNDPWLLDY